VVVVYVAPPDGGLVRSVLRTVTMCECEPTTVDVNVWSVAMPPDELDPDAEPDDPDEPELELELDEPDELDPEVLPPSAFGLGFGELLLLQLALATGIRRSVVVAAVRNSRRVCMSSSDAARSNACATRVFRGNRHASCGDGGRARVRAPRRCALCLPDANGESLGRPGTRSLRHAAQRVGLDG
jgi:hypothetical protein